MRAIVSGIFWAIGVLACLICFMDWLLP